MRAVFLVGVLAFVAAPAAAQRTLVVDAANGPGTNFVDVPPAYTAAQPGDTILIRSGTYTLPAVPIAKPITVLGTPQAQLCFASMLHIAGVPAGTRLVLGNLQLSCAGGSPSVAVTGCLGGVHFEGLVATDVLVSRSPFVTFAGSRMRELAAEDSIVALSASRVDAGPSVGTGRYALVATRSRITLGQTAVVGPSGRIDPFTCRVLAPPSTGARLVDSTVLLGRTSMLWGGILNGRPACNVLQYGDAVQGTRARIEADRGAALGRVTGSTTVVRRSMPTTWAIGTSPGATMPVRVAADAGSLCAVLASLPFPPVPTPFGELWVVSDPSRNLVLGAGVVDANQRFAIDLWIPTWMPRALPLTLQSGVLDTGELLLSNPATILLYTGG